jgi:hypothetical protein
VGEVHSRLRGHRPQRHGPPRRGRRCHPQAGQDLARQRHPLWQVRRLPSPQLVPARAGARPPLLIPLPLLRRNRPPRLSRCRPVRQNHQPLAQPVHRSHPPPGRPAGCPRHTRSHPRPAPPTRLYHPPPAPPTRLHHPPPARPAHPSHWVRPPRLPTRPPIRRVLHRSLSRRGDRPA